MAVSLLYVPLADRIEDPRTLFVSPLRRLISTVAFQLRLDFKRNEQGVESYTM